MEDMTEETTYDDDGLLPTPLVPTITTTSLKDSLFPEHTILTYEAMCSYPNLDIFSRDGFCIRVNKVLLAALSPTFATTLLLPPATDPEPMLFTELDRDELGHLRAFLTTGCLPETVTSDLVLAFASLGLPLITELPLQQIPLFEHFEQASNEVLEASQAFNEIELNDSESSVVKMEPLLAEDDPDWMPDDNNGKQKKEEVSDEFDNEAGEIVSDDELGPKRKAAKKRVKKQQEFLSEEEEDFDDEEFDDGKPANKRQRKRNYLHKDLVCPWGDFPDLGTTSKYKGLKHLCDHCDYGTNIQTHAEQHRFHHDNPDYRDTITQFHCPRCLDAFTTLSAFKLHANVVHQGLILKCRYCTKYFQTQRFTIKVEHEQDMHENKAVPKENFAYECVHCGLKFRNDKQLKTHLRRWGKWHTAECVQCGEGMESWGQHQEHVREKHQDIWIYICGKCDTKFSKEDERKSHRRYEHETEAPWKVCDHCGQSVKDLKQHIDRAHPVGTHPCPKCGWECGNQKQLEYHISKNNCTEANFKPVTCNLCHITFEDNSLLSAHVAKEHEGSEMATAFACPLCPKVFPNSISLNRHRGIVHVKVQEGSRTCDICGKEFSRPSLLKFHITMVHKSAQERTHKCDICGKMLSSYAGKLLHMSIHQGNFRCLKCKRRFKTQRQFDLHNIQNRCHKLDKTKKCNQCDKVCSNLEQLNNHVLAMHTADEDKPFKCRYCPKGFAVKHRLEDHENTHTNARPHGCRWCSAAFNSACSVVTHENKMHKAEKDALYVQRWGKLPVDLKRIPNNGPN